MCTRRKPVQLSVMAEIFGCKPRAHQCFFKGCSPRAGNSASDDGLSALSIPDYDVRYPVRLKGTGIRHTVRQYGFKAQQNNTNDTRKDKVQPGTRKVWNKTLSAGERIAALENIETLLHHLQQHPVLPAKR